jgi:hypothetical protein
MRNRFPAVAALLLPALLLAGCVSAPTPIDPPDTDIPGGSGDGPVTGIPAVDDEFFFGTLEEYKTDLDEWRDQWLQMGCSTEVVATGEMNCALHLTSGGLIATSIQILFGSTGIADFALSPQVADLDGAQDAALASYEAAEAWADENCAGAADASCLPFTTDLVDAVLDLHEELLTWSR